MKRHSEFDSEQTQEPAEALSDGNWVASDSGRSRRWVSLTKHTKTLAIGKIAILGQASWCFSGDPETPIRSAFEISDRNSIKVSEGLVSQDDWLGDVASKVDAPACNLSCTNLLVPSKCDPSLARRWGDEEVKWSKPFFDDVG